MIPEIILLFSSLVGICIALVYLIVQFKNKSALTFNLFFILLSFDVFVILYVKLKFYEIFPQFLFTNWTIPFIYGPMLYLHFLYRNYKNAKFRLIHLIYLLPFVVITIYHIPSLMSKPFDKYKLFMNLITNHIPYLINDMEWIFHSVMNSVFAVLSVFIFKTEIKKKLNILVVADYVITLLFPLQALYVIIFTFSNVRYLQNEIFLIILWIVAFIKFIVNLTNRYMY